MGTRNKESIQDFMSRMIKQYNDKLIFVDKKYWASEWSWTPICDGIYPYQEYIRGSYIVDGIRLYTTKMNFRIYYPWELHSTKEECQKWCNEFNSFGYDYDIEKSKLTKKLGIELKQIYNEYISLFVNNINQDN